MSVILDVARIAATAALEGSGLPAYKRLFDEVVEAFRAEPDKQEQLRRTYDEAMADAERAHQDAQSL